MQQHVVQHKCGADGEVTSKVTHRKIGKILKAVGKKLQDIMWMKDATEWREEDFFEAINDEKVVDVVKRHVHEGGISLQKPGPLEEDEGDVVSLPDC